MLRSRVAKLVSKPIAVGLVLTAFAIAAAVAIFLLPVLLLILGILAAKNWIANFRSRRVSAPSTQVEPQSRCNRLQFANPGIFVGGDESENTASATPQPVASKWHHVCDESDTVEIIDQSLHVFTDGVLRDGVRVRDAHGSAYWIEKAAFDRMYRRAAKG